MSTFSEMGLPPSILQSLSDLNFAAPTPIQEATIPLGLQGRDVLGTAQTGTGKTLAFGIPLVAKMLADPQATALVLAPTRELAQQVYESIKLVIKHDPAVKMALLIGGESMFKQFQQLRARPRIVVGTPGRVIDHLERGSWKADAVQFLVLDEADRMLDMGFGIQIEQIVRHTPQTRQTLMFSATLPRNILRLTDEYLTNPERVSIGSMTCPSAQIKQEIIHVTEADKYDQLVIQLNEREGSIIVFVKTKHGAERLADKLCREEHSASAIHGDLKQQKREKVIQAFRRGRSRIMVATDVAARGLDIPHIQHVINYDLPQSPEDYIHRIGRTARAGADGNALCLITPQDGKKWKAIHRLMHPDERDNDRESFGGPSGGNRPSGRFAGRRGPPAGGSARYGQSRPRPSYGGGSGDGQGRPSRRFGGGFGN